MVFVFSLQITQMPITLVDSTDSVESVDGLPKDIFFRADERSEMKFVFWDFFSIGFVV
jgi:hypothetical protein